MKTRSIRPHLRRLRCLQAACLIPLLASAARASIAYGSINNFDTVNDTVNDTGSECRGFEIEIGECHSTDISDTKK